MKIKLDENIPHRLTPVLTAIGHDVRTVADQGLTGHSDDDVWRAVAEEERFLVTQDVAFGRVAITGANTNTGVLLLRFGVPSGPSMLRRAKTLFETQDVASWRGCVVVATERKIRVRRL